MNSINLDDIVFGEEVAQNSNGQIFKAKWFTKDVAVKKVNTYPETSQDRESKQLLHADHENIVFLQGTAIKDYTLYLIMEWVDGGSLYTLLFNEQVNYELAHVVNWALQIAKGIEYMHNKGVIHRDINPSNILLCNCRRNIKITNFTFARALSTFMTNKVGTIAYMAPEVMVDDKNYSEKCDVYGFAITLWEMLARKKAYGNYSIILKLSKAVQEGERPSLDELQFPCPGNIKNLLTDCWSKEPSERPSMKDIINVLTQYPIVVEELSL